MFNENTCINYKEVAMQLEHHVQSDPVFSTDTIGEIAEKTVQLCWSLGGGSELNCSSATLVHEKRLAVQNHEKSKRLLMFSWNTSFPGISEADCSRKRMNTDRFLGSVSLTLLRALRSDFAL